MADSTVSLHPPGLAAGLAGVQRRRRMTWGQALTTALSVLVLGAAVWQAAQLRLADITALIPEASLFWLVLAARYFAVPAFDWVIFHRLWRVGRDAFAALLRKLIYNELLLGYLGEAYFYAWAKRRLPAAAKPFGAVKDNAILSAVAGNVMTLVLIALAYPYLALLPLDRYGEAVAWSLALIVAISLGALLFGGRIFSLSRRELWTVFALHMVRITLTTALTAWAWHLALPQVALGWWLVLSAMRLLVSRLPFVPNKDVVFAGIAVLALGEDVAIAALMAMMAALILAIHLILAFAFGLHDLVKGHRP
jgi:hypothetical protein